MGYTNVDKQFDLKFLGIGSAFNTSTPNSTAYFNYIQDGGKEHAYFIDFGGDVLGIAKKILSNPNLSTINCIVTHCHLDHIGGISTLAYYCYFVLNKKLNIYVPTGIYEDMKTIMRIAGNKDIDHNLIEMKDDLAIRPHTNLYITPLEQSHGYMTSYGYKITMNSVSIFYSGDSGALNKIAAGLFNIGAIDYIYQDTSVMYGGVHMKLSELCQHIPVEKRKYVYCYHADLDLDEYITHINTSGFQIPNILD